MTDSPPGASHSSTGVVFGVLAAFLLLLPFGLSLPGTPGGLKADESAYYMMAMSLAFDGDVRLDEGDTERLFDEFSGRRTRNVVVSSNDGWQTVYYGKPHLYSLFAAPFARVAGYRGILMFNLALFLGLVWCLWRYLAPMHGNAIALLFASAFYLLSTTWNYAFWIQPEILSMFGVGAALFLGLRRSTSTSSSDDGGEPVHLTTVHLTSLPMALASGAMLAVAVYNKPYLAPLGLVFLVGALMHARSIDRSAALRWFSTWCGGALLTLGVAAGSAYALTGSPSSYVGVARDSVTVCEPGTMPLIPERVAQQAAQAAPTTTPPPDATTDDVLIDAGQDSLASVEAASGIAMANGPNLDLKALAEPASAAPAPAADKKSWTWIFRIPPVPFGEHLENLVYFLVGRHTGLLIYFPFVGAAIVSFLWMSWTRRRRRVKEPLQIERWTLLATTLGIGVFLLVFIAWNWQGGGGFVGNRYFVTAVPAFGYLALRLRPVLLVVPALAAGLFLGPSLLSPFGLMAPEPTLQAHTRSGPLSVLPLELSLKNVPGYHAERLGGMRLVARTDQWLRRGESFWTQGRNSTAVTVLVHEPLGATSFLVTGVTDRPATVDLSFAGAQASATVDLNKSKVVTLAPQKHRKRHNPDYQLWHVYPLLVSSDQGSTRQWQRYMPPNSCPQFGGNDVYEESFFAGAQVSILGPAERLRKDLFSVAWNQVDAPSSVASGTEFEVPVDVTNTSSSAWPTAGGSAQVSLSYHWLNSEGDAVEFNGRRSHFAAPVAPGSAAQVTMKIQAPSLPGQYVLELDPVFEHVAWFSARGADTFRVEMTVAPQEP